MLGRPEAAEDFGVPLQPDAVSLAERGLSWVSPDWLMWVVFSRLGFLLMGCMVLVALAVTPPHPIDPVAMLTGLVYASFTLAFVLILALFVIEKLYAGRRRRAEGRADVWRRAFSSKGAGPPRGP